mmetsp:Transcript_18991/g.16820  ORF Transcript_18991/g.16820 Transcript_18991/m.16820 type:complete len:252 (+) Transcript_18991:201-956(+)
MKEEISFEIDHLYTQLKDLDDSIGRSMRKLQLLHKIQKDKSSLESFKISSRNSRNTLDSSMNDKRRLKQENTENTQLKEVSTENKEKNIETEIKNEDNTGSRSNIDSKLQENIEFNNEYVRTIKENEVEPLDTPIDDEPWYMTYLSNKGLIFSVIIMMIIAYNLISSKTTLEDTESNEFRSIKNLLSEYNNNLEDHTQKLDEISKLKMSKLNLSDFDSKSQSGYGSTLRSNLKAPNSPSLRKMNVRFADEN